MAQTYNFQGHLKCSCSFKDDLSMRLFMEYFLNTSSHLDYSYAFDSLTFETRSNGLKNKP